MLWTGIDDMILKDFLRIITLYGFLEKAIFRYTQGEFPEKFPAMWRENEGHYDYFWVSLTQEMFTNLIVWNISELACLWEFTLGIKDLVEMIFGGQICTNV